MEIMEHYYIPENLVLLDTLTENVSHPIRSLLLSSPKYTFANHIGLDFLLYKYPKYRQLLMKKSVTACKVTSTV